jgi:O-antigen ligase/tetratricopeptide (TPR) repeat protein
MSTISLNTFLRQFILAGVFIVPFIAFVVIDSMFFPFITGKNFIFRIIVELMLGAWIVLALRDATYRPKRSWLMYAVGAFVFVIGLATLFGEDISKSFWSNYERMDGYITQLHLFAYFLIIGSVLNTERLWKYYLHTLIGASVGMAFIGLAQIIGVAEIHQGNVRIDGNLGNAAYMASYMLFHIALTAYFLFKHKGATWVRYVYVAIIAFEFFIMYETQTRGALLGFVGATMLITFLIIVFDRTNVKRRNIAIGILTGASLLVGAFFLEPVKQSDFVQNQDTLRRIASISLTEGTTQSRFLIWSMAVKGVQEHSVLGWGQGNFTHVFNKHYVPEMYRNEPWFDRAHNIVFDWLIAGGVLGLLGYLGMFLAALMLIWRRHDNDYTLISKAMFTGLLAAYFFQNIFVFDNLISYMLFFTLLAYVHFRGYNAHASHERLDAFVDKVRGKLGLGEKELKENHDMSIPAIALVLTLVVVFTLNQKPIAANLTLIEALRNGQPQQQGQALELFEKALAYESFGTTEVRERMVIHASRVVGMQIDPELKRDFTTRALEEMDKQIADIPQDAKYPLFSASLLNRMGRVDDARDYLFMAREISPYKEPILFEIGVSYINAKQYDKALEELEAAFMQAPKNKRGAQLFALALIYAQQEERLPEVYEHGYDESLIFDRMFVNAWASRDEKDKVLQIWKVLVATNPGNLQYHISLAATHASMGQTQEAIAVLEKAKAIDERAITQIDTYINELREGKTPE